MNSLAQDAQERHFGISGEARSLLDGAMRASALVKMTWASRTGKLSAVLADCAPVER